MRTGDWARNDERSTPATKGGLLDLRQELKADMNVLKSDVNTLKEDVSALKNDVSAFEGDVNALKAM